MNNEPTDLVLRARDLLDLIEPQLEDWRNGMTHYLLTVHGPAERDEVGNYGSKEEMEESSAGGVSFAETEGENPVPVLREGAPSAG